MVLFLPMMSESAPAGSLKKIPVTGGTSVVLASVGFPFGASWQDDVIAIGQGAAGRRPVYALTLHGVVVTKWTLSTAPYDGPIDAVGSDLIGDGTGLALVT